MPTPWLIPSVERNVDKYDLPETSPQGSLNLDLNENPLPLPASMRSALLQLASTTSLHEYPRTITGEDELRHAVAVYAGVTDDSVLICAGSDEGLRTIFNSFCDESTKCLFHHPSYTYAQRWAQCMGAELEYAKLSVDDPNVAQTCQDLLTESGASIAYLCSPNNPDGLVVPRAQVDRLVSSNPSVLFIFDEAYVEFDGEDCSTLIRKYKNLIITRTFSKAFGLASLRIGYCLACPELINDMHRINNPKACSNLARSLALTALTDSLPEYQKQMKEILDAKRGFTNCVRTLIGVGDVLDVIFCKGGNFLLIPVKNCESNHARLKEDGLYVRVKHSASSDEGCLRITIGGWEHMRRAFCAISKTVSDTTNDFLVCFIGGHDLDEALVSGLQNKGIPIRLLYAPDSRNDASKLDPISFPGVQAVYPESLIQGVDELTKRVIFCESIALRRYDQILEVAFAARGNFIIAADFDATCNSLEASVLMNWDESGWFARTPALTNNCGNFAGVVSVDVNEAVSFALDACYSVSRAIERADVKFRVCSTLQTPNFDASLVTH